MTLTLMDVTEKIRLHTDEHGIIRIVGSRITLDTIITVYKRGESPEDIIEGFPTLNLSDVYHIIGYYLDHTEEVEEYLRQRAISRAEQRQEIESHYNRDEIRTRLLARRKQQET